MQYKKIFSFKIPQFYFVVIIFLLISTILFNLGLSIYQPKYKEGVTSQELKELANSRANANIAAKMPVSQESQKAFDINIVDSYQYGENETKFTDQNPNASYLISSTSEKSSNQNSNSKQFKINQNTTVSIPIETSKFNDYIVIAPDSNSIFPPNFTLTIINHQKENGLQISLWGSTKNISSTNGIIGSYNIDKTPYSGYVIDNNGVKIAGLNIGNNALNIFSANDIYDNKINKIGSVTQTDNTITINCTNSTGITGILIYLGIPTINL
jgi:hypothetical protein